MPIGVYPSNDVFPRGPINRCKTTYRSAQGRDKGRGPTAATAVQAALAGARAEIAKAVTKVQTLPCPNFGGCDNPCVRGRVVRVGKGIDRKSPVKKAGVWECEAWGFESFEIHCRCPK